MKVVILGAKGMLGSALCRVFADLKPVCWDKEEVDITDVEGVRKRLGAQKPDVVINAAAYTDVDGAESHRKEAFAVNETGVSNLASAAKEIGATLIHYSTDYVFPGDNKAGYAEDRAPGPPLNGYGESKLAGERALRETDGTFYLIRTAWLYGPGGKNFVDTMLNIAQTRRVVTVVSDQYGSPTYTKDVARATRSLLAGDYKPGIYHAVNSGTASWSEFAQRIFEYASVNVTVEPISSEDYKRPAKRPQCSILRNTRGPKLRSWEEALREYLKGV